MENDNRGGWTSASQASYDLACPGRHLAQRQLPDTKSEEAESGTRIHAVLAGRKDVTLNDDEGEIAIKCAAIADSIIAEWGSVATCKLRVEDRLWMAFGEYQHSGQPDLVLVQGNRALIWITKLARAKFQNRTLTSSFVTLPALLPLPGP
jgi:hypothetical protein